MKPNNTVWNFAKHCMSDPEFLSGGIPTKEKMYFKKLGWKEGDENSCKFYEAMFTLLNLDAAVNGFGFNPML